MLSERELAEATQAAVERQQEMRVLLGLTDAARRRVEANFEGRDLLAAAPVGKRR